MSNVVLVDIEALKQFLLQLDTKGTVACIPTWKENTEYTDGVLVLNSQKLYCCIKKHTSSTKLDNDINYWLEIAGSGGAISSWKVKTKYNKDDMVIYDSSLYICINQHVSSTKFEPDNWKNLSSASATNYSQVTKLDITAPVTVETSITKSPNFAFPPINVLKLTDVATDVSETDFTFDAGDGKRFTVDDNLTSESRLFSFEDGLMRPEHKVKYAFGELIPLDSDNFYSESEEIDISDSKLIDSLELVEVEQSS